MKAKNSETNFPYAATLTCKTITDFLAKFNGAKLRKLQKGDDLPKIFVSNTLENFPLITARRSDDKIFAAANFSSFAAVFTAAKFIKTALHCIQDTSCNQDSFKKGLPTFGENYPVYCTLFTDEQDAQNAQTALIATLEGYRRNSVLEQFENVKDFVNSCYGVEPILFCDSAS